MSLAAVPETSDGPHVVNQVFTAATGWGYAARCGCGWKPAHDTHASAADAGQGHMRAEHATAPAQAQGRAGAGC